jgi:exonuclease III
MLLSTLFSNTLSLCSSLNVRDHVSHQYRTTGNTEDKTDNVKVSFYEELKRVFDKFPKYHMKILSGDFNANEGREDSLKLAI